MREYRIKEYVYTKGKKTWIMFCVQQKIMFWWFDCKLIGLPSPEEYFLRRSAEESILRKKKRDEENLPTKRRPMAEKDKRLLANAVYNVMLVVTDKWNFYRINVLLEEDSRINLYNAYGNTLYHIIYCKNITTGKILQNRYGEESPEYKRIIETPDSEYESISLDEFKKLF